MHEDKKSYILVSWYVGRCQNSKGFVCACVCIDIKKNQDARFACYASLKFFCKVTNFPSQDWYLVHFVYFPYTKIIPPYFLGTY